MSIYSSSKVLPYVYKCIHKITGKIYIGSRIANKMPSSQDFGTIYKTSSKIVKPFFDEFDWHIVAEFFNGQDAYDFEQQLIHKQWQVSKEMSLNRYHHYNKESWNNITDRIIKQCLYCETEFKVGLNSKRIYCCGSCKAQHQVLIGKNYTSKIVYRFKHIITGEIFDGTSNEFTKYSGIKINYIKHLTYFESKVRYILNWTIFDPILGIYKNEKPRLKQINKTISKCRYCNKTGSPSNISRWHNNNCKFKV